MQCECGCDGERHEIEPPYPCYDCPCTQYKPMATNNNPTARAAAWQILEWWADGNDATILKSRKKVLDVLKADRNAAVDEFVRRVDELRSKDGPIITIGLIRAVAAEMKGESNGE